MAAGIRTKAGAVLVMAAIVAGGSATPAAALPRDFFGVVAIEQPTPAELQLMAQGRVQTARVLIDWRQIERQPGGRDWRHYDSLFTQMAIAGVTPTPLLFGVPLWIHPHNAHPPIYTEFERAAWSRLLTDLAARYGPNGELWRMHPELPPAPLTKWVIWNEPNLKGFWDGKPKPRAFARLLMLSADSLRESDPKARIVMGGLFPRPRRGFGMRAERFLKKLYRVRGARKRIDAVALHPFASRPRGVLESAQKTRKLLNQHRARRTPMWIDEVGWTTGGVGWRGSPYRATEAAQAKRLRRTFRLLIKQRKRLRLQRLFWFSWRDYAGPVGNHLTIYKMGLFRDNGTAKPAWRAYSRIAR